MWPLKKNRHNEADTGAPAGATGAGQGVSPEGHTTSTPDAQPSAPGAASDAAATAPAAAGPRAYDPIHGDFGPFDGDAVDYRDFDFSDFAKGGLDLGSMLIPVPHEGEVQVEMGPEGPQMIHILTPHGRITPVAFAAPRKTNLWEQASQDILTGMENDGLTASVENGPWGEELLATAGEGAMRVIGVSGDRWMLRLTLAGPASSTAELATVAREIAARTFVRRGSDPMVAGDALPVRIPQAMAEELQRHIAEQMANQVQTPAETSDAAIQPGPADGAPAGRA